MTEGQGEPTGKDELPEDDQTTAVGPRVLLLGSDEFGPELAIALQRLGAEVTAVDGNTDEPAAVFHRLQPDFVVTLTDAVSPDALDALVDVTELVPSASSIRLTADREGLRKLAADQLGLPTAPFWFVGSVSELEAVAAHAGFPLLVKPVVGRRGAGQSVIRGADDVKRAWQHAIGSEAGEIAGDNHRVWAETVVEIEFLVTLIVVRSEGPNGPIIEFCSPIGHRRAEAGEVEAWQPQEMSTPALDAAKSIAARIVKALGGRGVFGVELMINGDEVYFADVTAFPRESAWVTVCSQRLSVFELQARAILGLSVDTMMVSPGAARTVAGAAPSADALTAAIGVPESDLRVFGQTGQSRPTGAPRGLGVTLATAPDVATARERAREVARRLNMRDSRG